MTIMRDVAILKSEFTPGEKAVTKIQNFCYDDVMFEYCCLPEVKLNHSYIITTFLRLN